MMHHKKLIALEMVTVIAACILLGFAVGVATCFLNFSSKSTALSAELDQKNQRLVLFEDILHQMSKDSVNGSSARLAESEDKAASVLPLPVVSLDDESQNNLSPPISALKSPSPPALESSSRVAAVRPDKNAGRQTSASTSRQGLNENITPANNQVRASPSPEKSAVTSTSTGAPESIHASKLGVKFLLPGGVLMLDGRVFRVGDTFPSGERLLKVDLENSHFSTTERHISLIFN